MKLVKPSWEIIDWDYDKNNLLETIYEQIEYAGRICYKSERKEGTTAKDFVDKIIARKHLGVLEHGTVYLKIPCEFNGNQWNKSWKKSRYEDNHYSKVRREYIKEYGNYFDFVSTNYRVLYENGWLDDLKYLCEPTKYHEKRIMTKFVSMIHFYKDIRTHRNMSFCIESTRFCNYSKGKFGAEITYIIPSWLALEEGSYDIYEIDEMNGEAGDFLRCLRVAEEVYLKMINFYKWKPQQAAKLLPQDTKADIIMSGFVSDYQHMFNLRTSIIAETGQPDTEVSLLFDPLYNEFKERKLI